MASFKVSLPGKSRIHSDSDLKVDYISANDSSSSASDGFLGA